MYTIPTITVLLLAILSHTFGLSKYYAGRGCGTTTQIRHFKGMPGNPTELKCAFVHDEFQPHGLTATTTTTTTESRTTATTTTTTDGCIKANTKIEGGSITDKEIESFDECWQQCLSLERCAAVSHNKKKEMCSTYSQKEEGFAFKDDSDYQTKLKQQC